jgi:ATP-dependent Clp protease ATP-binding subunit ClpA
MAIKWDRLTVKSQEAVQAASGHAAENGNPEVLPLHLMAALLEDREGVVIPVLEKVGVPVEQLLSGVNSAIAKLPKVQGRAAGDESRCRRFWSRGSRRRRTLRMSTSRRSICCWRCRKRKMIRCSWRWRRWAGRMRRS